MGNVRYETVNKRFNDVTVLSNFELRVADGEFMVLLGPSGSGKTTALRILAGLEPLSDGHVWIGDRRVEDLPPRARDIAMVFQDYALYPQMSVYENMAFGLKVKRVPKDEIRARVKDASELLGISELLKRKPAALSGGQRQRVALGRALVRDPEVFLMDEPLSNLDAKLRAQTRGEIPAVAEGASQHHHLRDTRPGRSHDDGRPRRHLARWATGTGRRRPQGVRGAYERIRGRVPGQPRHGIRRIWHTDGL